ncbi:hypothetical protein IGI37_003269 [Enterococcus sp. AZ194]|uniref:WxL domain-containing protein n=1 Tax=Enterococcus sp. AZ194 TaxID=2774629 RepID=UPI003F26B580
MKTRTLCSAALLALVSSAVLLPVGASAAPVENPVPATGTGSITYTQGNDEPDVHIPGKDGEEDKIDEPSTPEDWSPLMVIAASPLNFKEHKIGTFTQEQTYYASNFTTTRTNSKQEVTMENFVKFRDIRGVKDHNYTVSAQLTKQFTSATDPEVFLKGAAVNFANAELVTTETNGENKPDFTGADDVFMTAFTVAPNAATGTVSDTQAGDSVTVLSTKGEKGFGVFDIKFGDITKAGSVEGKTQSEESVSLTVPHTAQLVATTYQAEITWSIAELPATGSEA